MIGAHAILQARHRGLRPKDFVFVSLVGKAHIDPLVIVPPGALDDLDFRMLVDLDVCVLHGGQDIGRTVRLADMLARVPVRNLDLQNARDGSCVSVVAFGEKFIREVPPCI